VTRWIDRWNRYWFPTTTTRTLALCRIIAVSAQLYWFPSLLSHINLASKNPDFVDPQVLIRAITFIIPRDVLFTPQGITTLYWITLVAGLTALVGLFSRPSLFIFALGNWIFVGHRYSYADVHHPEALFAIFLMTLALAPSGRSLSLDALLRRPRARNAGASTDRLETSDTAMWPLKLAHVLLAMTYFSTGASKVIVGGLGWMNGYTVQIYTFANAMPENRTWGIWLAGQHTFGVLLGAFTVLFELFFFVSLVLPRTAPFFFFNAILFHIALYVTMGHQFFLHIILNAILLFLLHPGWFRGLVNRLNVNLPRWSRQEQAPGSS